MGRNAGLAKALGALLLIGLALLVLKWALITAAILVVPFGVWWIHDRLSTRRRNAATSPP